MACSHRWSTRPSATGSPILITAAIESVDIIDDIDASTKIYYCADEYSTMPGLDSKLVSSLERELFAKVDLVIATSMALQKSKSRFHDDVRYLPHGVDYGKFKKALDYREKKPLDLPATNLPIIGFVGILGPHINFEIISALAENISNCLIILIGPVEEGTVLPNHASIKHLGAKEHDQLPEYLAHFNVCIVPYVTNSQRIKYASPTKLREYLAAGCPVVSIPQPEAKLLADYVDFADNTEAFVEAVFKILHTKPKYSREEYSLAMKNHTWPDRARAFMEMINSTLEPR